MWKLSVVLYFLSFVLGVQAGPLPAAGAAVGHGADKFASNDTAKSTDESDAEEKPTSKFDGLWTVLYETPCSSDITFTIKITNGQLSGSLMATGTSGDFDISGAVYEDGGYDFDGDGGDYGAEGDGRLSGNNGRGRYLAPTKSSFMGCDGDWTWQRQ